MQGAKVTSNPRYSSKAREVATALAGTDGVALTVELIEREHGRAR